LKKVNGNRQKNSGNKNIDGRLFGMAYIMVGKDELAAACLKRLCAWKMKNIIVKKWGNEHIL